MSKYTLTHVNDDGTKLTMEFEDVNAFNIVQNFVYFLQGVSFHEETITDALESIVDSYVTARQKDVDFSSDPDIL